MVATTRIILSGILEDFPDLKFVISHKGGGIAVLKERMNRWFGFSGAPGSRTSRPFDEYFGKIHFNMAS